MDSKRKLMHFYFLTKGEISTHYHQDLELFYVLTGELEIKIDDQIFLMKTGDIVLINANKRHTMNGNDKLLAARFQIDFHLLAEYMGSLQLLFWCNTVADKNGAYQELRKLLNRILSRYFEKDDKGALYLDALYYETAYVLTSNFLIKSDDTRLNLEDSQDRARVHQIQNYIQANYQAQISLNDLAQRLYLSNAYLSKYVKKHLGLTFMEYLSNVRLFHAVDELLYTKKNMTHIALDNGFPSSAAFTKAFRDIYRESPSEYRKKMQKTQEPLDDKQELSEEEAQRIHRYLKYKEDQNELEVENQKICFVDVSQKGSKLSSCNKAICVGNAYMILQSDVQKQLKDIQKATGIKYVRIWNIFSKEVGYNEGKGFNFRKIDLALDFLLENHMKPYLEFGHKRTEFFYTPERYLKKVNQDETYDENAFTRIVKEFSTHLVNRYGIDEIESWYFEYWNNSGTQNSTNVRNMEDNGEYYRYFEMIYQALKDISPQIKVGGAGFILGYETLACKRIFLNWKQRTIRPDFISVYSYQSISLEEDGKRYGRKSIDTNYMKNQVEVFQELMEEVDFHVEELHITEWNYTISNRNIISDSCEQGAYVLKNCIDMNGKVGLMAYWHALDSYSDYYDADKILNGDSGMISRDGIRKPSFYAYMFMDKLLPYVLYKDEHSIITTNGRDRYVIACHNFKKLSSKYVFTEEDEITVDELPNYTEDDEAVKIQFHLANVKDGNYLLKIHYVNKEKGSIQDIWRKLEYSKNLAKDEMNYLEKSAIPWMEMRSVHVDNGVLELENILKEQEIRLLDIQYRYTL